MASASVFMRNGRCPTVGFVMHAEDDPIRRSRTIRLGLDRLQPLVRWLPRAPAAGSQAAAASGAGAMERVLLKGKKCRCCLSQGKGGVGGQQEIAASVEVRRVRAPQRGVGERDQAWSRLLLLQFVPLLLLGQMRRRNWDTPMRCSSRHHHRHSPRRRRPCVISF